MNPKICECGAQGSVVNSRQKDTYVYRRYHCKCGLKWTTFEMKLDNPSNDLDVAIFNQLSQFSRAYVASKLKDLANEIMGDDDL